MMIWTDPVRLPWSDDERAELGGVRAPGICWTNFPPACTAGPRAAGDSPVILVSGPTMSSRWTPRFPVEFDPAYAEIVIRGMTRMIPALAAYLSRLPKRFVDGGYYTKTQENRLLSGPLPVEGAYVLGASPATG